MDYLEEYLSLVQSLKSFYIPVMELNLKIPELPQAIQKSRRKNTLPPPVAVGPTPLKQPKMQRVSLSKEQIISPSTSNNPFHAIMKKALPKHIFYEYPPIGISHTKKLPSYNLPNVPLFFYGENPFDPPFLTNLISAIQDKFGVSSAPIDAREIEEHNLWRSVTSMNHLRCLIVHDTWIAASPHGRCWYRTQTNTNNCFLGTIPLIVLSSKTDWYRDIENKRVLWNQLCRILKKPFHRDIVK